MRSGAPAFRYLQIPGKSPAPPCGVIGAHPCTIHHHLEHIYAKLGVETRTAALALALRHAEEFATAER